VKHTGFPGVLAQSLLLRHETHVPKLFTIWHFCPPVHPASVKHPAVGVVVGVVVVLVETLIKKTQIRMIMIKIITITIIIVTIDLTLDALLGSIKIGVDIFITSNSF